MATLYRGGRPLPADACYQVERSMYARLDALADPGHDEWVRAHSVSWGPIPYETAFRALWSDEALVARFDVTDDAPWHTCTARDDRLWEEEVVELFLDPAGSGRDYAEVEVSPANVVCDLLVRTPWPRLLSDRRWHWEGLSTRVTREGGDWVATLQLPWTGLHSLSAEASARLPPRPLDRWRFNVFRIKRPHGPADPERDAIYAAWSVPDGPSFHAPAAFRDVVFLP